MLTRRLRALAFRRDARRLLVPSLLRRVRGVAHARGLRRRLVAVALRELQGVVVRAAAQVRLLRLLERVLRITGGQYRATGGGREGRTTSSSACSLRLSSPVRRSCPCCTTSGLRRILPFNSSLYPSNLSPVVYICAYMSILSWCTEERIGLRRRDRILGRARRHLRVSARGTRRVRSARRCRRGWRSVRVS